MSEGRQEYIEWSDDLYTIQQVVIRGLPTIVKVHEGYYTGEEINSFSAGDIIRLDFLKNFQNVVIRLLVDKRGSEAGNTATEDKQVMFPLEYKGKLKIVYHPRVFHSVKDLIRASPRLVKNEKSIDVQSRGTITHVESGDLLELDRFIPGEGLVCVNKDKNILLEESLTGEFLVLPDDNEYTLKDVIENFELPQPIQFLETDAENVIREQLPIDIRYLSEKTWNLEVLQIVRQEVIIGHYKPLLEEGNRAGEKSCRRALALLPLDSPAVNELEVQIPVTDVSVVYETVGMDNISSTADLNDCVYVDLCKSPGIRILKETGRQTEVKEKAASEKQAGVLSPKYVIDVSGMHRPSTENFDISNKEDDILNHVYNNIGEENVCKTEDTFEYEEPVSSVTEFQRSKPAPSVDRNKSDRRHFFTHENRFKKGQFSEESSSSDDDDYEKIEKRYGTSSYRGRPSPKDVNDVPGKHRQTADKFDTSSEEGDKQQHIYSEIREDCMCGAKDSTLKREQRSISNFQQKIKTGLQKLHGGFLKTLRRSQSVFGGVPKTRRLEFTEKTDKISHDDMSFIQATGVDYRQRGARRPRIYSMNTAEMGQNTETYANSSQRRAYFDASGTPNASDNKFPCMSVEELSDCFLECGLSDLAAKCREEQIDGQFMCCLDDVTLQQSFSLSNFEVRKVLKIKSGWQPNRKHYSC